MLILLFSRIIAAWEWVFFICDHHGCCVLACNERFEGVTSPELAEVVAWPLGVFTFSRDHGHMFVLLNSDCLSLTFSAFILMLRIYLCWAR